MKKLILLPFFILISCITTQKISTLEREQIISELENIKSIDQKYAGIPPQESINRLGRVDAWKVFETKRDSVGIENQNKIKKLFDRYGYLGFKEVGEENSTNFWITIQHADNDLKFQKKMLRALEKQIKINNAPKSNYAMLEDRIAANTGKKQRFGSQVVYNEFGQAIPKYGLIDSLNVDNLRIQYDLPTFKTYYNEITTRHFEMNKEYLQKKGINQPKLYQ